MTFNFLVICNALSRTFSFNFKDIPEPKKSGEKFKTVQKAYKRFELMLTKCAKVYSSSCSQIALVYLQPFHRNSLLKGAAQPKIFKKSIKPPILGVQGLSKSSMLIRLKSSSLMLVVIGSMPIPICNRFHARLANNGKITTFSLGVPLFNALMRRFP